MPSSAARIALVCRVRTGLIASLPYGCRSDAKASVQGIARAIVARWSPADALAFDEDAIFPAWVRFSAAGMPRVEREGEAAEEVAPPPAPAPIPPVAPAALETTPKKGRRCDRGFDKYFMSRYRDIMASIPHSGTFASKMKQAKGIAYKEWVSLDIAIADAFCDAGSAEKEPTRPRVEGRFAIGSSAAGDEEASVLSLLPKPVGKRFSKRQRKEAVQAFGEGMMKIVEMGGTTAAASVAMRRAMHSTAKLGGLRGSLARRVPGFSRKMWRGGSSIAKKLGRPRRSFKINKTKLADAIEEYTTPSSRFYSDGTIVHTLRSSKRNIWKSDSDIRQIAGSRSTFMRHLKKGVSRVARGTKRTDVCQVCWQYDAHVHPKMVRYIDDLKGATAEYMPNYFTGFSMELGELVKPSGWLRLHRWIDHHRIDCAYQRGLLLDDSLRKLEVCAASENIAGQAKHLLYVL
jgi:hypothetical protein